MAATSHMKGMIPWWKKAIRLLLITIAVVALIILYFLVTDERPTPLAEEWFGEVQKTATPAEENAFFFWAGFSLPEGQDPVTVFNTKIEEIRTAVPDNTSPDLSDLAIDTLLVDLRAFHDSPAPEVDELRSLLAESDRLVDLDQRAAFLHKRFQHLNGLDQFKTPFAFTIFQHYPSGVGLLRYQNFRNLLTLQQIYQGNHVAAVAMLDTSLTLARYLRGQSDYMLAALSSNVLILRNLKGCLNPMLDWTTPLSSELIAFVESMPLLSTEERSLRSAMHGEGWIIVNSYGAGTPDFPSIDIGFKRIFARPQTTRNLVAEAYDHFADLSELPGPQYMTQRSEAQELAKINLADYLRSMVGVQQTYAIEGMIAYIDAGFTINGYILLLKAKAAILEHGLSRDEVAGFLDAHQADYYNIFTGGPLEWDAETGILSFTGPDQENSQKDRQVSIYFTD